jgi:metal-responsive CopG/Arc/MetJ family transcriptional regulator
MDTLTLKIPGVIKEKLKTYSRRKGLSRSEIVRNALLEYFDKDELEKQGTFYDLAKDLAGCVNGSSDLSTNKEYISGYGQ